MSFSALFDHSSSTPSPHPLQNPYSFLPVDRLSLRRRPHGDDRLHRHRRAEAGPDLCQRKMDPIHSFPNATDFIGTDGAIKIGQKEMGRIAPALAENPLNLTNFGVPYSLNRKKRWNLTELSAEQLNTPKSQAKDLRVSIVWQKANPLRKGTINGPLERFWPGSIGRFGEDKVTKLSTFDAGKEIHRQSKSTRGANSTAQLMKKGTRTKKRLSRRNNENGAAAGEKVERWMDLFEDRDYSAAANPSPTCSAWSAAGGCWPPPVHTYYTFRTQSASRHQLNSGWQDKCMGKAMTRGEMREGGRWTTDWQGNAKWETLSRRQITRSQNGQSSAIVQKHRGVSCAKGGQRFAIEADFEEHFLDDENEHMGENGEEEGAMEEQNGEEMAGRKPMGIGDCVIGKSSGGRQKPRVKTKHTKRSANAPKDVLRREEDDNEKAMGSNSLSVSALPFEEKAHKLWRLPPAEVDTIKANMAELVPLDDALLDGPLPSGTSIFQCQSDAKTGEVINKIIPSGALLIVKRGTTSSMDKYLLNPGTFLMSAAAADHQPPKYQQRTIKSSISACSKIDSGNGTFLSDLLENMNSNKRNLLLIESEPLYDDAEADSKAVRLLFSKPEQRMDDDIDAEEEQQQRQEQHMSMPYCRRPCSSSALCAVADQCSDPTSPPFCGVCLAQCSVVDCFALRRCEPFRRMHTFCDDCWRRHIEQCVANGRLPIPCMAPHCPSVVRPSDALLVVGQPIVERYRQLLAKRRRMWRDFVICAQCDGIVCLRLQWQNVSRHLSQQLSKCAHCDETICCRCAQRQHLPLSCEERELYELILRAHGHSLRSLILSADSNGRLATGVRCTNCANLVEKSNGCDHIICHCGFEFCWKCGGDWKRHRNCVGGGRISVPLFDLVFTNGPNGKKLAKAPEKFFAECAEFRTLRRSNGRKLFKQMGKAFADDRPRARHWTEKYLQASEFIELYLVKRMISDKKAKDFSAAADRLRFTFCSVPFIAKVNDAEMKPNREMVERNYEQIVGISKRIVEQLVK